MKTLIKSIIIASLFGMLEFSPKQAPAQEVSFQVFYDGLSPYGHWVNYAPYGFVWIPSTYGFIPYSTGGYWVYSDDEGWVWVSDYDWGWAPFHYGCWENDPTYGWFWIPGETWGPAWVSWSYCNGYYGWAPLGYHMSPGYRNIPANRWVFVGERHIADPQVSRYYAPRSQNTTFIRTATAISSSHGPSRAAVEKSIGHSVTPVTIQRSSRPGQSFSGKSFSTYRPSVAKTTSAQPHPAPAKVADIKTIQHQGKPAQNAASPAKATNSHRNTAIHSGTTNTRRVAQPSHSAPKEKAPVATQKREQPAPQTAPQHPVQNHQVHTVHHSHPPVAQPASMPAPHPAEAPHEGGEKPH